MISTSFITGTGFNEVHPDDALGLRRRGAQHGDRDRRRIGREHRLGSRVAIEHPKQIELEIEPLGRRLDREADLEVAKVRSRIDVREQAAR